MALRVVLADDNFLVRQGTAALLDEVDGVEVVDVAEEPAGLLAAVAAHSPDAVLTDLRMPPTFSQEGIEAAKEIRRRHPGTGVVVLSQYVEPDDVVDLLSDGVAGLGYLLKERVARVEELVRGTAPGGRRRVGARPAGGRGAAGPANRGQPLAAGRPHRAELAVLGEMATGKNNIAIARTLYLSERAVEKHTNALFSKLGPTEERDVNRRVLAVLTLLDAR